MAADLPLGRHAVVLLPLPYWAAEGLPARRALAQAPECSIGRLIARRGHSRPGRRSRPAHAALVASAPAALLYWAALQASALAALAADLPPGRCVVAALAPPC